MTFCRVNIAPQMLVQLDAGSEERIMLISRDEQSCLVVSYKEVKSCIDSAFRLVLPRLLRQLADLLPSELSRR